MSKVFKAISWLPRHRTPQAANPDWFSGKMCISQHTVFYLKKDLLPHLCLTKSTCSWIHFRFHQPFLLLCCIDLSEVHMSYHHHTLISQVLSSRHKPLQGQKPMQIMWQWSKTLQPRSILRRLSYNYGLPWPKQIRLDLWHDQGTPSTCWPRYKEGRLLPGARPFWMWQLSRNCENSRNLET